jgi:cytochrome c biogenesis protein CcmG/thiol:disulfide interchange protein DsbE
MISLWGRQQVSIKHAGATMRCLRVVVFVLIISLMSDIPLVKAQFPEAGVEKFKVAVAAPDFTLKDLGGGNLSLKELKGKVVILNFFATY